MARGEGLFVSISERVDVDVDVDVLEIVTGLDDKQKARVVTACGLNAAAYDDLYVRRAYESLMAGRGAEALAYLESYLHPAAGGRIHAKKKAA